MKTNVGVHLEDGVIICSVEPDVAMESVRDRHAVLWNDFASCEFRKGTGKKFIQMAKEERNVVTK